MRSLLLAAAMIAAASPALADEACDTAEAVANELTYKHGEDPHFSATRQDRPIEFWANRLKGTWTIVEYRADGTACVIASGSNLGPYRPRPRQRDL